MRDGVKSRVMATAKNVMTAGTKNLNTERLLKNVTWHC
jgi:hypothetical protein